MTLITSFFALLSLLHLEERRDSFVQETKKIEIPEYPIAFNPSIVRWQDMLLMSFRVIPNRKDSFTSNIGIVRVDENFCPVSTPQIFELRKNSKTPCRAEDARLLCVGKRLMIVYSDNDQPKISKAGFRMHLAEVLYDGASFSLKNIERLTKFEGESESLREKNWVPFDYEGDLLLSYSLSPHKVFLPFWGAGACDTLFTTDPVLHWDFGILRGGTPAIKIGDEYLSIFHSSIPMASLQSNGQSMLHYFMGAYTFSASPPFELKRMSKEPIVGKDFYNGPNHYKWYWKAGMYIFPAGIIVEEDTIWMAYGRQDHEIWVAKIDRRGLLDSLIDIAP